MSEESYRETVAQLAEVVALRNDLVHHFISKHDVWSTEGCSVAIDHLGASYERIDGAFVTLQHWAHLMNDAAATSAVFLASQAWEDWVSRDARPSKPVELSQSTVVQLLRARAVVSIDGWCSLSEAIVALSEEHPEHTLKGFGCTSWRQLLHESGQFVIRRDRGTAEGPGKTWYRRKLP